MGAPAGVVQTQGMDLGEVMDVENLQVASLDKVNLTKKRRNSVKAMSLH